MQCTEEFYKEQVLKQLSERSGNDVDEKKVLEMLARIEKTEEEEDFEDDGEHIEDIDSDDSVEEGEFDSILVVMEYFESLFQF